MYVHVHKYREVSYELIACSAYMHVYVYKHTDVFYEWIRTKTFWNIEGVEPGNQEGPGW